MGKSEFDLTVNVMMVGGRRCGKTSVLAAMQSCFEDQLNGTPLVIGPADWDMLDIIEDKQREMARYFLERGSSRDFIPDQAPTEEILEYQFYVGLKDKKNRICVKFVDYPGEWLSHKDRRESLINYAEKSRILLIAIDTPHLMEQKGRFNDNRNLCRRVSEMVKNIGFADAEKGPGMVLLVPLKCERYYNRQQMGEVSARVQEAYKPLLQYLQQPGINGPSSRITIAITPILTMGGAEFGRFQRDDDGNIMVDEKWGTPLHAIYHFPDMNKEAPEPQYCEQPLLYVLSHVFEQARRAKKKLKTGNGLLDVVISLVQSNLLQWPSAEDYLKQAQLVNDNLKQDGDGYSILSRGILKL